MQETIAKGFKVGGPLNKSFRLQELQMKQTGQVQREKEIKEVVYSITLPREYRDVKTWPISKFLSPRHEVNYVASSGRLKERQRPPLRCV